ncbi:hypothetical protein RclHR1_10530007 [Rhizophagus clarus]|uniref:Protein kinase domain-containing protein n=1 Tax=Rhizophagus clarus TaxID=94130 RepID=A0A2Z6QGG2_9GLOM|nr:hypothetical protein RclHR1_10530007 [Rhizophagus clarus]
MEELRSLSFHNDKCKECDHYFCFVKYFQQNFKNWTSGNEYIDKFIKDTQLSAHGDTKKALEWITFDRFRNIKYIEKIGIYKANWVDGLIYEWDSENKNWKRFCENMFITLKSLSNPKNITIESMNEIRLDYKFYGITQDPQTKNYMMVLNDKCKKCNYICNAMHFQNNFDIWTSGNKYIDKFIQDTQLSAHNNVKDALEWISYERFYDIKFIAKFGVYRANLIDETKKHRNDYKQYYIRVDKNMVVTLKNLINPKNVTLEFMNEIKIDYEFYGITQDPQTKNYMVVLGDKCKKCNRVCNAIHFQHNFKNWTSGNDYIDRFIQDTQLSAHDDTKEALEWIPHDRFYGIEIIKKIGVYRANWIDGYISYWDNWKQNWMRYDQNILVTLRCLNNSENITTEFINKIKIDHCIYGITQDLQTKNYMIVLNDKCKKCNYVCNAIRFQHNFKSWTSGNDDIDKFIQDTQLSAHNDNDVKKALEWIPYNRFENNKFVTEWNVWIDGNIRYWDKKNQNWERHNQNMRITLKNLNNPKNVKLELTNKLTKSYGITQDPQTKNYVMVLSDKCKKCYYECKAVYFQENFENWTSGNDDIDKLIQDDQLSAHKDVREALEWIPYKRFYDIKYIKQIGIYEANLGNMFAFLKSFNNPKNAILEFKNEFTKPNGITQDPQTKNYMMVLNDKCKECNKVCEARYFHKNFINWSSGNNDIDRLIRNIQLSVHYDGQYELYTIEWIPYDRFKNIEYIAKGGFGKVYKANWIDGHIEKWDSKNKNWIRNGKNMLVALKSLNNSKNVTFEFMNEVTLHHKGRKGNVFIAEFYGITQDPETKNYMMVLDYAEGGSLRNYLNKVYNELDWNSKIANLDDIAFGLLSIHKKELIHRDLHIGNILKHISRCVITDMGLCKPANYKSLENSKSNVYGILPYIAPEILRGQEYTKASDIYSFGIIMYEVISGLPPYYDLSHDNNLAIKICQGLRPRFNIKVPQLIIHLIKRCLDANPLVRPKVDEIEDILYRWKPKQHYYQPELQEQIKEADEINKYSSNDRIPLTNLGISYKTHSEAIYASRSLNFNNLPEPKNSDDYYKQTDNIISLEFSESLQIDISQLNINEYDQNI